MTEPAIATEVDATPQESVPEATPSSAPAAQGAGHTRISGAWVAVALAVVLGVALIAFIVQNTRSVRIDFFGASGHIPVAVALLGAALAGALVVLIVGVARVTQLRVAARRNRKAGLP